jgi:predicted AAA+ superfamily ATPase
MLATSSILGLGSEACLDYHAVTMNNRRSRQYFNRALEDRWLEAAAQFPVLLLTGPRQVGKTTTLEYLCEADRRYVTLDDLALRSLAREDPSLFLQRFPPPVLIDEIQYAPELLPEIKVLVDSRRSPGSFWLTGSQQFQMMKGVAETLAGRVAVVNLLGFSVREKDRRKSTLEPFLPAPDMLEERQKTGGSTSLPKVYRDIWLGSFPALATGEVRDRDLFYRSYLQTYLERDVRSLMRIGDLETFRRFVRACAARTAQLLNYADLARDVDLSVNTARAWMSILVASFQVYLLQPYHSNVTKRLIKTPKLYFLDTGLCSYLTEWSSPETLEAGAMSGALLETHVFVEVLKSWWHRLRECPCYFVRDKEGREIDLLLSRDNQLFPIEVKKAAKVDRQIVTRFAMLRGIAPQTGPGGVVCFYPKILPIDPSTTSIPVGLL